MPVRPIDRPAADRLRILLETASLSDEELGAYLRAEGLHDAHLAQWRSDALNGLGGESAAARLQRKSAKEGRAARERIAKLERELRRKDKALAEAAALLVLEKKVREIWGDEDDATAGRNG